MNKSFVSRGSAMVPNLMVGAMGSGASSILQTLADIAIGEGRSVFYMSTLGDVKVAKILKTSAEFRKRDGDFYCKSYYDELSEIKSVEDLDKNNANIFSKCGFRKVVVAVYPSLVGMIDWARCYYVDSINRSIAQLKNKSNDELSNFTCLVDGIYCLSDESIVTLREISARGAEVNLVCRHEEFSSRKSLLETNRLVFMRYSSKGVSEYEALKNFNVDEFHAGEAVELSADHKSASRINMPYVDILSRE